MVRATGLNLVIFKKGGSFMPTGKKISNILQNLVVTFDIETQLHISFQREYTAVKVLNMFVFF